MNPVVLAALLIGAAVALSYAANYLLARLLPWKVYRVLVGPGIIVHEYAHAIGCVITGAPIRQIRVFDARGGAVVHGSPRLPFGQAVITLAPLLAAALAVYGLAALLLPRLGDGDLLSIVSWQFVVFICLAASITVTMTPSAQDAQVGMVSLLGLSLVLFLVSLSPLAGSYLGALFGDSADGLLRLVGLADLTLGVVALGAGGVYALTRSRHRR